MTSFDPAVDQLSLLVSDINNSLKCYANAQNASDKADALKSIADTSQRLRNASISPLDAFSDFTLQPLANACVRIAIAAGVFEQLLTNEALRIEDLAERTNTEVELMLRVLRVLVAFGILQEKQPGLYAHTLFSAIYVEKPQKAWATWLWDEMIRTSTFIGPYFEGNELKSPTDPKKAPFAWARNEDNMDVFEIVRKSGKLQLLQDAMSGSSTLCAQEAVSTYRFDQILPGEDSVVLVDVGGNKGQTVTEIRRSYPSLKGRVIVQDLQPVIESGGEVGLDAEFQAYDFFEQVEPVKGAGAYLYQRIFHDWNDDNCKKILANLKPAMSPHSKLLISDTVVPDHDPHSRKVLRDMNMLLVGGRERSEKQWHALLESEGFRVTQIYGLQNMNNSIIEAVLK